MHRNRKKAPKTWNIPKKGTKYIVRGRGKQSVPMIITLRNILELTKTKKETKTILNLGYVKVNNEIIKDENFLLKLNDILSLKEKHFKCVFNEFKKFSFVEINEKEINEKISKVIGKKRVSKNKIQINLSDGRNYLVDSDKKVFIGDSCVVDLKNRRIKEFLKLEKNAFVVITEGKHLGKRGKIKDIDKTKKTVLVESKEGEINVGINQIQIEK